MPRICSNRLNDDQISRLDSESFSAAIGIALAGYYALRPLRDQMGIIGGINNLPWLFTATFVTLLVAQPLYGGLVAKLPRSCHRRVANGSRAPLKQISED